MDEAVIDTAIDKVNDIQLFDIETLKSPHRAHKRLRDHAPVYFARELGLHVVTRYDLLREALRGPSNLFQSIWRLSCSKPQAYSL